MVFDTALSNLDKIIMKNKGFKDDDIIMTYTSSFPHLHIEIPL